MQSEEMAGRAAGGVGAGGLNAKAEVALVSRKSLTAFIAFTVCLALVFSGVLRQWLSYALDSNLYSHMVLIPFVSAYLIWIDRSRVGSGTAPARILAVIAGCLGAALLAGAWLLRRSGVQLAQVDFLAFHMLGFWSLLVAGAWFCFGPPVLRMTLFPAVFLVFAAPLPDLVMDAIVSALQYGSADVAYCLLKASGIPILRNGTLFDLPGISMAVAPQCSGIHSTLVLFIVSIVAGHLFLQRPWARILLAAAVIPLALLRNGFRIFTLGQLCVHISPDLINSWIHKQGGPVFFALSLIPFLLLLLLLKRMERPAVAPGELTHENHR